MKMGLISVCFCSRGVEDRLLILQGASFREAALAPSPSSASLESHTAAAGGAVSLLAAGATAAVVAANGRAPADFKGDVEALEETEVPPNTAALAAAAAAADARRRSRRCVLAPAAPQPSRLTRSDSMI